MVHHYRRIIIIGVLLGLLLIPSISVLAAEPEVEITVSAWVVGSPEGFTLSYVSDHEVFIEWTKGEDAVNTMVRAAYGRLPESRTDGYLVYVGNLTSCSDTGVSLDEIATLVHYRAWSQNAGGSWEIEGVNDSLEGFGMTTLAIALFVFGFTVIAIWRRDAVFYMLSVIGWLAMTFYLVNREYPEENAYLPYAIATFCLSVTLVMAIQTVRVYFSDKTKRPTSEDIQREHREKVVKLVRPKGKPWYYE